MSHIEPYWSEAIADVALLIAGKPLREIVFLEAVR